MECDSISTFKRCTYSREEWIWPDIINIQKDHYYASMKHTHSILICVLEDGSRNIYINGAACFVGEVMVQDPSRIVDRLPLGDMFWQLNQASIRSR